jgi:DNA-directed RNA polymerase subunit RPC12/RpoP
MAMDTTLSVRCPGCGASLPITTQSPRVRCGYCGAEAALDPRWVSSLRSYETVGSTQVAREALARRAAALHAQAARWNARMLAFILVWALCLTWWFVAGVSGIAVKLPVFVSLALMAVTTASTFGVALGWARMIAAPSDRAMLAVGLATCDGCGGFITFRAGEAIAGCTYCGSRSSKPAVLMHAMLAQGEAAASTAGAAARSAAAENWKTASEARLLGVKMGAGGYAALATLGAVALTALLIVFLQDGDVEQKPTAWIWVVLGLSIGGAILSIVRATKRLMADNAAFERRYGVKLVPGHDAFKPPAPVTRP